MFGRRFSRRALLAGVAVAPGCLPQGQLKIPYNRTPRQQADGWPIAAPDTQGVDNAAVDAAYKQAFSPDKLPGIVSLVVSRNGVLIAEGYMRDVNDIDRAEHVVSVTKSITSILTGIALDKGILASPSQRVLELLARVPDDPRKSAITIEHLATMRSGLGISNDEFAYEIEHGGGRRRPLDFVLSQPLAFMPGERFWYRDVDPHLLAEILSHLTSVQLDVLAAQWLFTPLGITNHRWLRHPTGLTYGAYGCFLRPRDLAKLGQLVLFGGAWNGQRVVSQSWIDLATSPHALDASEAGFPLAYGYWWWVEPQRAGIFASGHGGQYIWIDRARQLVVVLTAAPDAAGNGAGIAIPQMLELVDVITSGVRS